MLTHRTRCSASWNHPILSGLILLVSAGLGHADDPPARATQALRMAAVPSDPIFSALLVDGSVVAGRLLQIDATKGVVLAGPAGEEQTVATDRLVRLTRDGASSPTSVGREIVLLPQGDRLARCVVGVAGETTLDVRSDSLGKVTVPLDAMVGVILLPPSDVDAAAALEAKVRTEPHTDERLWLSNGDRLDGLFAGLTEKQILWQPSTGPITLARSGVVALGFNPANVTDQPPRGAFFEWLLLDGSRVGLNPSRVEQGQVIGQTRFGVEVRFPIGEVARVRTLGSSVDYLADRDADRVGYESYLGPTRPYRRNTSILGTSLRLGGQVYDRGLGTQSRTLLAYRLDPRTKRFQATVGLDDGAGPLGNVVFTVMVDGKVRAVSPTMGAGDTPKTMDIDIAGGKVLVLITEFGQRGDVQDSGDWVEARIVR